METPADGVDSEYCRDCDRCRPGAALAWVSDAGSDQNSLAAAASPLVRAVSIELSRLSGDNDLRQRRWRRGFEPTLSCGKHHDRHVTTRSMSPSPIRGPIPMILDWCKWTKGRVAASPLSAQV